MVGQALDIAHLVPARFLVMPINLAYGPKIRLCLSPLIKGERGLRNTPMCHRSDSAGLRSLQNRAVHFGLSAEHQAWKAPVSPFFCTTLAGELMLHAQLALHEAIRWVPRCKNKYQTPQ